MSLTTAQQKLEDAKQLAAQQEDPVTELTLAGLIELTRSLRIELAAVKSKLNSLESRIK